jgi:hypothetical protein
MQVLVKYPINSYAIYIKRLRTSLTLGYSFNPYSFRSVSIPYPIRHFIVATSNPLGIE